MKLLINPLDKKLDVEQGGNLLDALIENQIPISYSCRAGRCSTCQCRLIDGDVSGLNAADGKVTIGSQVLACMTTLHSDCTIEIPEPDEVVIHPARVLKGIVTCFEYLTHDVIKLRLKTNKSLEFSPGQYAQLQFSADAIRPYSMAGVYGDSELEFHIRVVPDGRVTPRLTKEVSVGSTVKVSGPLGASYLRFNHSEPMLCIAGGTGLAPIISIVRGALESGMKNPIHLYFGVRAEKDIYGLDVLDTLTERYSNFQYKVVLSASEDNSHAFERGFVTEVVNQDLENLQGWRVYLAGPPPMVEAATQLAEQRSVARSHIYADAFYPTGI